MTEHLPDCNAASWPPERVSALLPRLVARQSDVAEQAVIQLGERAPLPAPLHPEQDRSNSRAAAGHQPAAMPGQTKRLAGMPLPKDCPTGAERPQHFSSSSADSNQWWRSKAETAYATLPLARKASFL
jgi:hypothetical protein